MKKLIFLLILFSSIGLAQSDPIDSIRVVTSDSNGVLKNATIEGYSSGRWRYMGTVLPISGIQGLQEILTANTLPIVTPTGKFLRDDKTWQTVSTSSSGSLFELDASGNTRPILSTSSDPFYELDSFGNIRPKI
jgi:hypothetical protein